MGCNSAPHSSMEKFNKCLSSNSSPQNYNHFVSNTENWNTMQQSKKFFCLWQHADPPPASFVKKLHSEKRSVLRYYWYCLYMQWWRKTRTNCVTKQSMRFSSVLAAAVKGSLSFAITYVAEKSCFHRLYTAQAAVSRWYIKTSPLSLLIT